jgi:GGDEF domain-containing protein
MFFKRRDKQEALGEERPPPGGKGGGADPTHVLRDELGLCQLWFLELRLHEELARAARVNSVFSLACWQLKLLPGEAPSQNLLQQAATLIAGSLRSYDIVARLDDERFVAILLDAPYEAASTVAFRIKGDLQVRVSSAGRWQAGIAAFPRDAVDGDGLIQAAFRRLGEDARAA